MNSSRLFTVLRQQPGRGPPLACIPYLCHLSKSQKSITARSGARARDLSFNFLPPSSGPGTRPSAGTQAYGSSRGRQSSGFTYLLDISSRTFLCFLVSPIQMSYIPPQFFAGYFLFAAVNTRALSYNSSRFRKCRNVIRKLNILTG